MATWEFTERDSHLSGRIAERLINSSLYLNTRNITFSKFWNRVFNDATDSFGSEVRMIRDKRSVGTNNILGGRLQRECLCVPIQHSRLFSNREFSSVNGHLPNFWKPVILASNIKFRFTHFQKMRTTR